MLVVKLGGSLDTAGTVGAWVGTLAKSGVPLIICPGGGPFADQVRSAQQRWPIADTAAHRMAILAMEQTAYLLRGLWPGLIPVKDSRRMPEPESGGRTLLWFPAMELIDDPGVPCSWDVTSDSLAAILAQRVGADGLVLVKSAALRQGSASVGSLHDDGILDAGFHLYGARCGCDVRLLSAADRQSFARLATERKGGLRVLFESLPNDATISPDAAAISGPTTTDRTDPDGEVRVRA